MTVEGRVENGHIVLNQEITLPEGMKVRVEFLSEVEGAQEVGQPRSSHYEHYQSFIGSINDLPADFAAQHDHYIHGTPKK